ncbi:MAG: enoyl-CoA hydratase/isomerase family protein [Candidatus Brocadiia bacterium]|nr:enoyl-CoA hydratase/isomerase family protein [Candidatus Brocadiia bacterium]
MVEIRKTPDGMEIPPPGPDDVLYEKADGYARITINRPTILNAMNKNVQRLLLAAFERAEGDDDVSAVILTGAGRAFSAGGDMYSHLYPDDDPAPSPMDVQMKIWTLVKPVVAAVRGHAVGQGSELAGVCDITLAAEDARFGEIQIRHGAAPPVLIAPFLLGLKKAKEVLLLGEQIDAQEAVRIGLANRVVPVERLQEEAETVARKIASLPQGTVRLNKTLVNRAYELAGFREALAYRDDPVIEAMASGGADDATQERMRLLREQGWGAFKESRDAQYQGD